MTIDPIVREALDVYAMQRTALATGIHSLEAVQGAEAALLSAVRTAHLQELRGETEEEALEKAVDAMDASNQPDSLCENGHKFELSCNACHRRDLRHLARAAAPLLLADKEREVETLREQLRVVCRVGEVNTATASEETEVLQSRVAALEGALKEEIALRNVTIMGQTAWFAMPQEERDTLVALRLAEYNTRDIRAKETEPRSVDRSIVLGGKPE